MEMELNTEKYGGTKKSANNNRRWLGAYFDADEPNDNAFIQAFDKIRDANGGNVKKTIAVLIKFYAENE